MHGKRHQQFVPDSWGAPIHPYRSRVEVLHGDRAAELVTCALDALRQAQNGGGLEPLIAYLAVLGCPTLARNLRQRKHSALAEAARFVDGADGPLPGCAAA